AFPPPAIPGIGTSGGVAFMLEDRAGRDVTFLGVATTPERRAPGRRHNPGETSAEGRAPGRGVAGRRNLISNPGLAPPGLAPPAVWPLPSNDWIDALRARGLVLV